MGKVLELKRVSKTQESVSEDGYDFEVAIRANHETKERLKKERAKANKGVVRSHRLG